MSASSGRETWSVIVAEAQDKFCKIAAADGNLVLWERESMYALQAITKSEYLQKCNIDTIKNAIVNVASVGLTLNPAMKLAYLVPREGVACLDISYIGLVKIATDSGGVLAVSAIPVRERDRFAYRGPFEMPAHDFDPFASCEDRGDVIGAYAVAKLASGTTQIDTISRQEINKIRAKSKAKSGPWFDWFDEMVKKTVIKRASKLWPRTERLAAAEAILNEHEGIEIEGEHTTVPSVPVIEGPKSKASPDPVPAASAATQAEQKKPPTDDRPILPNQLKILRAKMGRVNLDDAALIAKFGPIEKLLFTQFAEIQKWIDEAKS